MYHMRRAIQNNIAPNPTTQLSDSFLFEDVLGRTKTLPYEYFRYYEVIHSYTMSLYNTLTILGLQLISRGTI
jgi:hypothetical protein